MNFLTGLVDFIGIFLALLFVVYWAYAGRIVIQKEKNILVVLALLTLLILYPAFAPLGIYILYHRHVIPVLKGIFRKKKESAG